MYLLPPKPGVCSVCAVDHQDGEAHSAESVYYHYWFYAKHNRWPTWADAIAHCTPQVRQLWQQELEQRGAWTEPDDGVSIAEPDCRQGKVWLPEGEDDDEDRGSHRVAALVAEGGDVAQGRDAGVAADGSRGFDL